MTATKRKPASPVRAAVEKDLKALPVALRSSGLAATALAMAREIDSPANSATSKSMCAARLIDALEKLRSLVPEQPQKTKLDDIARKREQRLARASGT